MFTGHISLSRADRLMNAIVGENSEVEAVSDGNADFPDVEQQLSDQEFVPPYSP